MTVAKMIVFTYVLYGSSQFYFILFYFLQLTGRLLESNTAFNFDIFRTRQFRDH